MQLQKIIFLGLLSAAMLNGCSWLSGEENLMTISLLPRVKNQFHPKILWNHSVGYGIGEYYSNLHLSWQDTRVFAADRQGIVKALDVETGKEIWSVDLSTCANFFSRNCSALLSGGLSSAGDRVYVGSELAKIYALSAVDGRVFWKTTVAGEALSTPVVRDGVVLVHTSNGMLQALNEFDGSVKWTINLDISKMTLRGASSPSVVLGAAIVGDDNGRVNAVLMDQGQIIWRKEISKQGSVSNIAHLNDDVKTTPVVVNGVVYAAAYNGNLVAMDLLSGQLIWLREIGSANNFLVANGCIYLVDQDDRVIAVDTQSGVTLWYQSALLHRNLTSPVMYNGYIVTGDSEGYLHWINSEDGSFLAQKKGDVSGFFSTPIVAGDKLIVQAKNGKVYAFVL